MLLRRRASVAALVGLVSLQAPLTGAEDADIVKGARVFQAQCGGCHTIEPGAHRAGPSLYRVLGRPAASAAGFDYSPALRHADIIWTPETLDAFLEDPQDVAPGTRMVFWGLDVEERQQVIRFLEQAAE